MCLLEATLHTLWKTGSFRAELDQVPPGWWSGAQDKWTVGPMELVLRHVVVVALYLMLPRV